MALPQSNTTPSKTEPKFQYKHIYMANCPYILLLLLLSITLLLTTALSADTPPTVPITPVAACNATTDPAFCKSVLPPQGSHDLYSYSRFSLAKSLSDARKFLATVDRYLSKHSSLSPSAVRALQDCRLLADLNVDFLVSAGSTLNSSSAVDPQTDTLQTLLSALLTNQQTCLDGLQATASAWTVKNGLSLPLSNATKLYSVSLSLFSRAWVRSKNKSKKHSRTASLPPKNIPVGPTGRRHLLQDDAVAVSDVVVVSKDGTGNFTDIMSAVGSAPNNTDGSDGYYLIVVGAGVYEEYVMIPKYKKYVMMVGDGINQTVVTGDRNNVDGWTTFNSATFAVVGQGFVAVNMTFRNTAGPAKHQAVAVRNGADLSAFYSCSFEGYQDTLYTHSMRQFYKNCDVYGTVDYIFGNAAVVFQDCNIYSRLPMPGQSNTITAQGRTDPNQNTGTAMQNCNIAAAADLETDGTGSTKTYLGRPWKNYSRTVIMQSRMDEAIDPAGWLPWNGDFALSTLYYAEYNNSGPGSDTSSRVSWEGYHVIDGTDALNYTVTSFVLGDNWLPQTGVPYSSGLL